jgi:hypothetical protein
MARFPFLVRAMMGFHGVCRRDVWRGLAVAVARLTDSDLRSMIASNPAIATGLPEQLESFLA